MIGASLFPIDAGERTALTPESTEDLALYCRQSHIVRLARKSHDKWLNPLL